MNRTPLPELLDSLPPGHPAAQYSRRDLRLTNRVLGNHRWFARTLPPLLRADGRALELGARARAAREQGGEPKRHVRDQLNPSAAFERAQFYAG